MACKIFPNQKMAELNIFVGGHRLWLIDSETIRVEALDSHGQWIICRFPPWKFLIEVLQKHLNRENRGPYGCPNCAYTRDGGHVYCEVHDPRHLRGPEA